MSTIVGFNHIKYYYSLNSLKALCVFGLLFQCCLFPLSTGQVTRLIVADTCHNSLPSVTEQA